MRKGLGVGQIVKDFDIVSKNDSRPVACIFAIKKDDNIIFPLKMIE